MQVKEYMISKAVQKIRTEWAISDAKRDAGLVTPENMVRYDDISYGPHGEWNLLDIYHTKDAVSVQPAIISVHGGAWVYGSKELYQYYCMKLAQRGFTVVNFNYRLAPENAYPAPLHDINQVLCFLKEQGEKYLVDTENLFMVGDSAGAQLLSQYLTIYSNPEYAALFDMQVPKVSVRAAALNCGIYDTEKCARDGLDEPFLEYIGKQIVKKIAAGEGVPESLNTIRYMTGDFPPSYIMTSYHDFLKHNAKPLYQHLTALGVPCEYKVYGSEAEKEIAHVFHVDCKLAEADKCNDEECAFFRKYMRRIAMEVKEASVTESGLTCIIRNDTENDFSFGRDYMLQKKEEDKWQDILPIREAAMTLELLWVPSGESESLTINWEEAYGRLGNGHYRVIKPVSNAENRVLLTAEFMIKESRK